MKKAILKSISFYQRFLSINRMPTCRFYPTCSTYFRQAVERHGAARGSWLGLRRLLRCTPWSNGGIDELA